MNRLSKEDTNTYDQTKPINSMNLQPFTKHNPDSMALALVFLLLLRSSISAFAQSGNVAIGSSLTATDGSSPWLSPSGDFAFGFKKLPDTDDLFLLGIWYDKIPGKTVVWYANINSPVVLKNSKLQLNADQGLVLTDPPGKQIWRSESFVGDVSKGIMSDEGNFVLQDRSSDTLWQSFDHPTDTLLPLQSLIRGTSLNSRSSETNFTRGRFHLEMQGDGNLVAATVNLPSDYQNAAYYATMTNDNTNVSSRGMALVFNKTGRLYVLRQSGNTFSLDDGGEGNLRSPSEYYFRATLDFDGIFAKYYHPKNGNGSWATLWSKPDNICTSLNADSGFGACGYNSICRLTENAKRPQCECPKGFSLIDPSDSFGNCKADFIQGCEEDKLIDRSEVGSDGIYGIEELINIDWPSSDYVEFKPFSGELCKQSCLDDCLCSVSIFRDGSCWKKKLPLSNGRYDSSLNSRAFLKVRKPKYSVAYSDLNESAREIIKEEDRSGLILAGSVLLGTSVFANILLVSAVCVGFFFIYRKRQGRSTSDRSVSETNLRCFSYKELEKATDGFKEELGRGAFGIVYKGTLRGGDSDINVAVKKLNFVAEESEKEFRNEVNVIGKTHHKNLVRILGFCDDSQNRMIVYEFMSNGTLASYVFGDAKPSWQKRTEIALGVAKGLLYLHEECASPIIHCDIKPQNILLDEYSSAKISDFGLAKLLRMDQSQTHTAIRGTKGYVGPEWFRNIAVTTKVDVYSFGVVLLEIICCRRSVEDESCDEEKRILTDWAYDCFRESAFEVLVDWEAEAMEEREKLERFAMVAMWCIQESPAMRPTMRRVVQMLEGVVAVQAPPCPCPNSFTVTH